LAASRFAGKRVADYLIDNYGCPNVYLGQLEPGVAEWAAFILVARGYQALALEFLHFGPIGTGFTAGASTVLNIGFWGAHNAALREGVKRADAMELRRREPIEEQAFINIVLYNVLEPGDQCAAGNMNFCYLTFPIELWIGSAIYPQHYPAIEEDLIKIDLLFTPIWKLWEQMGARPPGSEHGVLHLEP
jgi:hypothetical protein